MTKSAVIDASLVDVRNVAAHKSLRLELHVPVERAADVMQAFGWATMADPIPVAIARLDLAQLARTAPQPEEPRKRFEDYSLPQQIGMRCNDPNFHRFLAETGADFIGDPIEDAAAFVRTHCRVESRKQILPGTEAAERWAKMDADFFAHQRGMLR